VELYRPGFDYFGYKKGIFEKEGSLGDVPQN
jgi:hypothetical protein